MTTIEDLSPEVLVHIFSHYIKSEGHMQFSKNIPLVCKTWRNHFSTPLLWKNIDVRNWNYVMSLSERDMLFHTQSLKICTTVVCAMRILVDPFYLISVLSKIRNLKSLEIVNNDINRDTMKIVANYCPNLERLRLKFVDSERGPITCEELNPFLTTCGPKLKYLNFTLCCLEDSKQLVTEIITKCTSLETLEWQHQHDKFPICEIMTRCPQLRKLDLIGCELVTDGDDNCFGFGHLEVFKAHMCTFHGLEICDLLKNANNLEYFELNGNKGLFFGNVAKIPSMKVSVLDIKLKNSVVNLRALEQAVEKWKHTLLHLRVMNARCNVTSILRILLENNPCPKLNTLSLDQDNVDPIFLKEFVHECKNLKKLVVQSQRFLDNTCYINRKEVTEFCDALCERHKLHLENKGKEAPESNQK